MKPPKQTKIEKDRAKVVYAVYEFYNMLGDGISQLKNGTFSGSSKKMIKEAEKMSKKVCEQMDKSIRRLEKAVRKFA